MRRVWHVVRFFSVWLVGDFLVLLGLSYVLSGLGVWMSLIGVVLGSGTMFVLLNTPWSILELPPASTKV